MAEHLNDVEMENLLRLPQDSSEPSAPPFPVPEEYNLDDYLPPIPEGHESEASAELILQHYFAGDNSSQDDLFEAAKAWYMDLARIDYADSLQAWLDSAMVWYLAPSSFHTDGEIDQFAHFRSEQLSVSQYAINLLDDGSEGVEWYLSPQMAS